MSTATKPQKKQSRSRTRIMFDLADVLSPEEIASFEDRAAEAGADNLTDHFLNVTVRKGQTGEPKVP